MPYIRDWTFTQNITATATTVTCALPVYESDDILVAICSADTGAQVWSASGWSSLFSVTNTCNLAVLYNANPSAGMSSVVITHSVAETVNVHILAISDADYVTPFNGTGGAGTGYRTASNSLARAALPVLTTTYDNCLILYINSESGLAVPGVLEGACTLGDAADGAAHSAGFSWGYQAVAGATPAVYANKSGTAAGVLATIGIAPAVRSIPAQTPTPPAYCAGDASKYIDPIHGATAYNGNTAFAATIVANFGAAADGATLANGTVAAAADVGLNSFHSMGQITGVTTVNTYAGGCLVLGAANKPDVTGKNVLAHVKPSTPKVYQNLGNINGKTASSSNAGVLFAMASSAGNYKLWRVHGAGTTWGSAQHVPIVINSAAAPADYSGTLNASSISAFGFAISGSVAAPVMQFGSLWVLDTTIVAGGTADRPVRVPGIVGVCAAGKERMSVLQQGASQMLALQPIQIGNGGADPVYLDLSGTAIEHPQQYSVTDRQVYYNSVDNVCGLTFYPGASDTIDIRNAVFSGKSKFHWRWHASMSTSATVLTSGAQVINSGDVQLRAITYSGMSFTDCLAITQNSATISGCTFKNSKITSATLADTDNISDCSFTSGGAGHAIEVGGTATTISFSGNTFTGYAASDGATGNEAIFVNIATGTVTLNISGGGSTPSIRTAGATVVVNNAVTKTFTGLPSGTEARVRQGSYTLAHEQDITTGSYSYSYNADNKPARVQFTLPGYVFEDIDVVLDNSNQTFPVTYAPDPSYTAS